MNETDGGLKRSARELSQSPKLNFAGKEKGRSNFSVKMTTKPNGFSPLFVQYWDMTEINYSPSNRFGL